MDESWSAVTARRASVYVPREVLFAGSLPEVCAVTGAPADGTVEARFGHLPGWTWVLLPFGVLPFLLAAFLARRTVTGDVPVVAAVVREYHRLRRRGTGVVIGAGLIAAVAAWSTVWWLLWTGLAIAVLIGGGHVLAAERRFIDGRPDDTGSWVRLCRVHPTFAAAVRDAGLTRDAVRA